MKFPILIAVLISISFATYNWFPITSPTSSNLNDVELRHSSYGWMCGDNFIAKYDGYSWTQTPMSGSHIINGISATDDNNAWAVGPNGLIMKYNGSVWQIVTSPTTQDLNDVYFQYSNYGYIVGDQVVLRYQSGSWIVVNQSELANYDWQSLSFPPVTGGWIGGNTGMAAKWNGVVFQLDQTPSAATITGMWFYDTYNGKACTSAGEILKCVGVSWLLVPQTNTVPLSDIYMPSSRVAWAVGEDGRILVGISNDWSVYPPVTTHNLNGISMDSVNHGFIVGDNGTLLEYGPHLKVEMQALGSIKASFR